MNTTNKRAEESITKIIGKLTIASKMDLIAMLRDCEASRDRYQSLINLCIREFIRRSPVTDKDLLKGD